MTQTANRRSYNQRLRTTQKVRGVRRVSATLSASEYERLAADAAIYGDRVTAHLKSCAFAHLDNHYLVPPDLAARLDELLAVMRGIGNNLNQLARHSNEMRYFLDTEEVRLQIRRLEDEIRDFIAAPPKAPSDTTVP